MSLSVLRAGPSALIQDLGRPGHAALGVTASGVADRAAAATALRAVGTDPAAAVIEILLGGLTLMTDAPEIAVVTGRGGNSGGGRSAGGGGGGGGVVVVDPTHGSPRTAAIGEILRLDPGDTLEIPRPDTGLRTYLAVRGGIDVAPVLGSRSRDTLAALGPPPLAAGDVLEIGRDTIGPWADGWHGVVTATAPSPGGSADTPVALEVIPGPRDDLFPDAAWDVLARTGNVSGHADRVGVRIDPARPVPRLSRAEIPSEGMVRGAVQIPADGSPVVFGPDHPVTGGYPVIGVLTSASADAITQLLPGTPVTFHRVRG